MKGRARRPLRTVLRIIRSLLSPCHLVTLSPCLLLLAGCLSDNRRNGDPLLGPGAAAPPAANGAAALPPASIGRPPGSTAALAAGPAKPGDARSGLQIGTTPPAKTTLKARGQ